jgi:hypothetical protein
MWKELSELDERISLRISAALHDHRNEIIRIGENNGMNEAELRERRILMTSTLGTVAGQGARRR